WTLNTGPNPDTLQVSVSNASASLAGVVTNGTQTFGGDKTFNGSITGGAGISVTRGAVRLTGNAASSLTTTVGALSLDSGAAINIGNTNATSVSLCNSAA